MDLNVKPTAIKFLEENTGEKFSWSCVKQRFLRFNTKSVIYESKIW